MGLVVCPTRTDVPILPLAIITEDRSFIAAHLTEVSQPGPSLSWQPVKNPIRADIATVAFHNTPVAVSCSTPTRTAIWRAINGHFHYLNGHSKVPRLCHPHWPRPVQPVTVDIATNGATQPQLIRNSQQGEQRRSFSLQD